jgi:ubiquinone/menaquinone biosynthesis C-methylase UbiE
MRGRLVLRALNRGNRHSVLAAVAATDLAVGQVAADVGFGGGLALRPLLDAVGLEGHVHGVELSRTALAHAQRRFHHDVSAHRLTLQHGDLIKLPLADRSVDAAITVNTIYFVANVRLALGELARVLRPGGRLVVGAGDPGAMATMPVTQHGFTLRPIDELMAAMHACGLTDVRDQRVEPGEGSFHLLTAIRPPDVTAAG